MSDIRDEAARHIAELTSALKKIEWQINRDAGSQWLAGQLYGQGIRVELRGEAP